MTVRQQAARVSPQPPSAPWASVDAGTAGVAVAGRDALGTDVRVAVWPPGDLGAALGAVDAELRRLDEQASRFRGDSEISRAHRSRWPAHRVSRGLAEAVRVALAAARWTGGLVDPTVGGALSALGYDRDFASIGPAGSADPLPAAAARPGAGMAFGIPGRSVAADPRRGSARPRCHRQGARRGPRGRYARGAPAGAVVSWSASAAISPSRARRLPAAGRSRSRTPRSRPPRARSPRRSSGSPRARSRRHRSPAASGGAVERGCITSWTRAPAIRPPGRGGRFRSPRPACATANAAATAAIVAGRDARAWLSATGCPPGSPAMTAPCCCSAGGRAPPTAGWS